MRWIVPLFINIADESFVYRCIIEKYMGHENNRNETTQKRKLCQRFSFVLFFFRIKSWEEKSIDIISLRRPVKGNSVKHLHSLNDPFSVYFKSIYDLIT